MAETPSLALDEQLCFALYAASRAVTSHYRPILERLGLTYPQYLVMLVLWERGGDTPVKDLCSALSLDYGTLSPLLKRLEASGYVSRSRRPDDERSVTISLTDAGSALRTSAECLPAGLGAAMQLSVPEIADLRSRLQALAAAVSSA